MARLSPQVLVQMARNAVQQELNWKPTAQHAPPIPTGATADNPAAALAPLDVRLLQQLGFRAYYDESVAKSSWPVPLGLSPQTLSVFGAERGILYESPMSGDILLQRSFRTREFIHAGLVTSVNGNGLIDDRIFYYDLSSIEGDTDHRGLLYRGYTGKLRRRMSPTQGDRFLRWAELEVLDECLSSMVA
ncbi:MAG: hypothetical protein V4550_08935 [Gemmatimonadota bacterium]